MDQYTSSILFKYGDTYNVKKDIETMNDILGRQGTALFIDVIAEHASVTSNKYKLSASDNMRIINGLIDQLKSALLERI